MGNPRYRPLLEKPDEGVEGAEGPEPWVLGAQAAPAWSHQAHDGEEEPEEVRPQRRRRSTFLSGIP